VAAPVGAAPWLGLSPGLVTTCLRGGASVREAIRGEAAEAYRGAQTVTRDDEGFLVFADVALGQEYTIRWRPPRARGEMVHALSIEATVLAPPWHVLCMIFEWDLLKTWNLFILESMVRLRGHLLKFWLYASCWFPWPFHNRHSHVAIQVADALDEVGAYVLTSQYEPLPEKLEPHARAPDIPPGRVLASVQRGTAALVEPVFPHEVPPRARELHAKYQQRAGSDMSLDIASPEAVR